MPNRVDQQLCLEVFLTKHAREAIWLAFPYDSVAKGHGTE